MWQDWVLTIAQLVFVVSLIPAIRHKTQKPPLSTAIPTTVGLVAMTVAYVSLGLWWSAGVACLLTISWAILAYQQMCND